MLGGAPKWPLVGRRASSSATVVSKATRDRPKSLRFTGGGPSVCIAGALDNTLTRKVSLSDPLQIVELKGLTAGSLNVAMRRTTRGALPSFSKTLVASVVGSLSTAPALFCSTLRCDISESPVWKMIAPSRATIATRRGHHDLL